MPVYQDHAAWMEAFNERHVDERSFTSSTWEELDVGRNSHFGNGRVLRNFDSFRNATLTLILKGEATPPHVKFNDYYQSFEYDTDSEVFTIRNTGKYGNYALHLQLV